jgi:hypothetical protein
MNFPRFWAKGSVDGFECWRSSNSSLVEAQNLAHRAASRIAALIKGGGRFGQLRYAYSDRPLREEVLREIKGDSDEVVALVTRNAYGCQVLNTARALFIDVDLPYRKPPGLLAKLFSKPIQPEPEPEAVTKARQWVQQHEGHSFRIYRTRSGLRLLATHDLYDPNTPAVNELFDWVGADPMYRKLCEVQKCFRARLTPKPWRCGVRTPSVRWPFADARAEARFRDWERRYQAKTANFRTCELLAAVGNTRPHPELEPIIRLHDEDTKVSAQLELA